MHDVLTIKPILNIHEVVTITCLFSIYEVLSPKRCTMCLHITYNRSLQLVVLSACWSGSVGGYTIFGGTTPALIQSGIPAVVATQLPISLDVAGMFMKGFYRAIADAESFPAAMNVGRIRIFHTKEWFIPTLYMRSQTCL
jgi:CHAT domain-containing protein